jgi:hypothetical protein
MSIRNTRTCIESPAGFVCKADHADKKGESFVMDDFHTLQEFMTFTKGITYILMVAALLSVVGFWRFLSGNDED